MRVSSLDMPQQIFRLILGRGYDGEKSVASEISGDMNEGR
jgi:hypothetical protein